MKNPQYLHYSAEHLWVQLLEDGQCMAGITDYAQDLLGDIVYVDAPAVDTSITPKMPCGLVESVKTGSDLHAPMSGVVTEINLDLQVNPEKINDAPYKTWIFKFKPSQMDELDQLLSAEAYEALLAAQ